MVRSRRNLVAAVCMTLSLSACDRGGAPSSQGGPAPSAVAAPTAAAMTQAVITMDAAHDIMTKKDAPAYTISPSAGLVIEVGDHHFPPVDAAGAGTPNAAHVARGSSGYFRASFSGKRIALNASSLDPVRGRGAFPGFE